jgi:hypothetical protein
MPIHLLKALWQGFSRNTRALLFPQGVTRLFRAKHTLSRELPSQADSSEELVTLESLRTTIHQPLFSLIAANTEIREQ